MPRIRRVLPPRDATAEELERLAPFTVLEFAAWEFLGTITIDELTPSQNRLRRKYKNRHAYARLRDNFAGWVMVGMVNGNIPGATGRRRLEITRYAKHERYLLDRGNLVGGCKPLLDAAIVKGLIKDDTEALLDDHYHQEVDGDFQRTEIRVFDPLRS